MIYKTNSKTKKNGIDFGHQMDCFLQSNGIDWRVFSIKNSVITQIKKTDQNLMF